MSHEPDWMRKALSLLARDVIVEAIALMEAKPGYTLGWACYEAAEKLGQDGLRGRHEIFVKGHVIRKSFDLYGPEAIEQALHLLRASPFPDF
jgi:hypothetical protein